MDGKKEQLQTAQACNPDVPTNETIFNRRGLS